MTTLQTRLAQADKPTRELNEAIAAIACLKARGL